MLLLDRPFRKQAWPIFIPFLEQAGPNYLASNFYHQKTPIIYVISRKIWPSGFLTARPKAPTKARGSSAILYPE
jgi:hypothetical protein